MVIEELNKLESKNGVLLIPGVDKSVENTLHSFLLKEKRFYPDDEVKLLPYASRRNVHKTEWDLRVKSFLRLREYFSKKTSRLNVLDLGCGNCWLIGQLQKEFEHNYFCVDIDLLQLEQASRLFANHNSKFIYADILSASLPANTFDVVILNSSLQYFPNISVLFKELFYISKTYVEIHIIDTPFYNQADLIKMQNESLKHFMKIGMPELQTKYYVHTFEELKFLRHNYIYNPYTLKQKIFNFVFEKDSPYPWIIVTR